MPRTNSRNLTLTPVGGNVRIDVTYNAVFLPFERRLAALGLAYQERIQVQGVDEMTPGPEFVTLPISFENQILPVTDGAVLQTIERTRTVTVPRQMLQEDPVAGDADEIRCQIQIVPIELPATTTDFTDTKVLPG
jgi:hypothetical protein